MRVLFLHANFRDYPETRPWSDFQNESKSGLIDRMVAYFEEVSRDRFHIEVIASPKVYTLSRKRAAYVGKSSVMLAEALTLAMRSEPEGDAELIAHGRPEVMVVFFAGPGAESKIGERSLTDPWSEAVSAPGVLRAGDVVIDRGMVVAESPYPPLSPFGVMCHEFGHVLGLPELYAPNKTHEGIGIWGLMGQGTWVGHGDTPPAMCAWSKLVLGWADPIVVASSRHVKLASVARSGGVVKIFAKDESQPDEYFLIENRTKVGADESLPAPGLLVWHVDESQTSFRRSQDDVRHKRVDLLTADSWPSHLDIGHTAGGNRGDAGDPWVDRKDGPGPDTQPSTRAYDGTPGRFAIRNISPAGEVMEFDVVFAREPFSWKGVVVWTIAAGLLAGLGYLLMRLLASRRARPTRG
jgi:immune inhibitor A